MSMKIALVVIFILTTMVGYRLIKNVPSLLHTPLMSSMNALSGITLLATMTVTAAAISMNSQIIGCIGIVCASINVVAGFGLTNRMLKMFKGGSKTDARKGAEQ